MPSFQVHFNGPLVSPDAPPGWDITTYNLGDAAPPRGSGGYVGGGTAEYFICDAFGDSLTADIFYLNGSSTPVSFFNLPPGFVCTFAAMAIPVNLPGFPGTPGRGHFTAIFTPFGLNESLDDTVGGVLYNIFTGPYTGYWQPDNSIAMPTHPHGLTSLQLLSLHNAVLHVDAVSTDAVSYGVNASTPSPILGEYAIELTSTWFYNPNTDQFSYQPSSPGPDWLDANPSISLTSVTPNSGT